MSTIKRIEVLHPDPVLRSFPAEEQTLARIAHVNNVIDQINDAIDFSILGFNFDQNTPTPGLVGVGARGTVSGSTNGGCRPGTQPYTYSNGTTGCISATLRTMYTNYLPVIKRVSAGVYTFTFPTAPPLGFDILMSPPSKLIGTRISVAKVNSTSFTVTAQDASGGAADGLLVNMYLEIKIYN